MHLLLLLSLIALISITTLFFLRRPRGRIRKVGKLRFRSLSRLEWWSLPRVEALRGFTGWLQRPPGDNRIALANAIPNLEALKLTTYAWFCRDGATLTKTIALATAARAGTTVTIGTATDHGLWPGAGITIAGATTTPALNGTYTVLAVVSPTIFTFTHGSSGTIASGAETGTVTLSNTTCGRENKPLPGDAALITMGSVRKKSITPPKGEPTEIWEPQLGQLVLEDEITNMLDLKFKLEVQKVSPLSLQLTYGTQDLTNSSTQANPLYKGARIKGWLKTQHYDHTNTRRITKDVFVVLTLSEDVNFDPKSTDPVMAMFEARVLRSTLNTIGF
jgi:hypothetical protein